MPKRKQDQHGDDGVSSKRTNATEEECVFLIDLPKICLSSIFKCLTFEERVTNVRPTCHQLKTVVDAMVPEEWALSIVFDPSEDHRQYISNMLATEAIDYNHENYTLQVSHAFDGSNPSSMCKRQRSFLLSLR